MVTEYLIIFFFKELCGFHLCNIEYVSKKGDYRIFFLNKNDTHRMACMGGIYTWMELIWKDCGFVFFFLKDSTERDNGWRCSRKSGKTLL